MVLLRAPAGNHRGVAQPPPEERTTVVEEVEPAYSRRRVVVDEGPPPPRRDIWGWIVAALMAAAAIVFLVLWLNERGGAETSGAPNLVGLGQQQARQEASSRGFELGVSRRASKQQAGTVLEQAPRAGEELEEGGRMMAVVSSGETEIAVPQLVGLNRRAAERVAETANLTVVRKTVASDKPAGTVVAQDPAAGEDVKVGSNVTVTVSHGPGLVTVPSVRGLTLDQAIDQLTSLGLVPRVIRVPSSVAEDTVIVQDPSPGQRVKRGATVRLNVSAGTTATVQETVTITTATTETVETTPQVPPTP
jgi:eukaryotic-like serine/threonine-protein kinase